MTLSKLNPPQLPVERWPWYWTYAIFLEERWANIQEISGMYGDEDANLPAGTIYDPTHDPVEIPKSIWHDRKKVDEWIDAAKQRHKEKNNRDIGS